MIAWDLLEEINFFKVIKASQLDKVRISPRMKHNPIIYSFILPQRFSKIFGRLSRKLFISQIPIFDFKELGRTNDWNIININGLKELEGEKMLSVSNEERDIMLLPHFRLLNEKFGHTFYTQYGILIENVPEEVNRNFYIAFTGEKGVGKTYLTNKLIRPEFIFETDSTTKDNFKLDFKGQQVIVVGQKDPSFNLDYIKSIISGPSGKPVYECRVVNLSDRINIEEKMRVERLKLKLEEDRRRQMTQREEARKRQMTQREEARKRQIMQQSERIIEGLNPGKVYVIAYREEEEEGTFPDKSDESYTDVFYYLYLSDGKVIKLSFVTGEYNYYGPSTYGVYDVSHSNWQKDGKQELVRANLLIQPLEYLGEQNDGDGESKLLFSGGVKILISENGLNQWYPDGSIEIDKRPFRTINE